MSSNKYRKRDTSSESNSDSSETSSHSRKKYKRYSSEENNTAESKRSKSYKEAYRAKRKTSEEKTSSKYGDRHHRRSRSRSHSYDRKSHKERSESREYSRRDMDKESGRSGSSRAPKNYEKDSRRQEGRDRQYDSKTHNDRRKNYFKNNDRDKKDERKSNIDRRDNRRRSRSKSFDHANVKWGKIDDGESKDNKKEVQEKQKPTFALSGKLTEETNTYKGVVIKYSEPPEARKPRRRWRLYPFKGDKALQTLYIHRESAYLIGRDRKVVDLPVDHPSCSKQHAALQYRLVPFTRDNGTAGKRVRPYIIDLESANGTYINNKRIGSKKYVELLEKDVIKFGYSSREYVLLHENSKDEAMDDDVLLEDEEIKEEIDIKIERA